VFAQKRSVEIGRLSVVDRQRRFLLCHATGEARADGNSNPNVDVESFRGPGNQIVIFFKQKNDHRINVHRFADAIEQFSKQLIERQIRERHFGDGLHLPHAIHRTFELQSRSLFAREQLRALAAYLQSVREEERARIAREVHDELGQTLTGLKLDLARLEKNMGYVWLPIELSGLDTRIEIDSPDGPMSATVASLPFLDPKKEIPAQG